MSNNNSSWYLLSRLRRAVKKVSLLLTLNMNRWRIASMLSRSSSAAVQRIRSLNDWPAGLIAACDSDENSEEDSVSSRGSSRHHLQRTISYPSDQDDNIDQKAEMFIANFRRQLRIERQVSLELRYCRGNSLQMVSP